MYVIENCHIFGQGNRRHFLQTHHLLRDDMANNLVSKDALYVSLNFILSAPSSSPGANQTRDDAQELRALAKRQQRVRSKMRPADGCQFLATIGDVDPSQISGKMLSRSLLLVGGGIGTCSFDGRKKNTGRGKKSPALSSVRIERPSRLLSGRAKRRHLRKRRRNDPQDRVTQTTTTAADADETVENDGRPVVCSGPTTVPPVPVLSAPPQPPVCACRSTVRRLGRRWEVYARSLLQEGAERATPSSPAATGRRLTRLFSPGRCPEGDATVTYVGANVTIVRCAAKNNLVGTKGIIVEETLSTWSVLTFVDRGARKGRGRGPFRCHCSEIVRVPKRGSCVVVRIRLGREASESNEGKGVAKLGDDVHDRGKTKIIMFLNNRFNIPRLH